MHVSLQPVLVAQTENGKAPELAKDVVSFSSAMSVASEAATTEAPREMTERSGDKRSSKKTETSKESSGASLIADSITQPITVILLPQFGPVPPVSGDVGVDPIDAQAEMPGNTIAPRSLGSDSATSDTGVALTAGQEVSVAGSFPITQGAAENSTPAVSAKDDASAEPVMNDTGGTSGTILVPSDETSVAAPVVDITSLVPATPAPVTMPVDLSADEVVTGAKKQALVESNDVRQIAIPVALPSVFVATPLQAAPVFSPTKLDLSAMTATGKPLATETEAKGNNLKPNSAAGKDRSAPEAHMRSKAAGFEDEAQGVATSMPPIKVSESPVATLHQGNDGQAEGNNPQTSQMAQTVFAQETSQAQAATHATVTMQTVDVAGQSVPSATSDSLDVPATPTLSGARLIQSVHQSEMKLAVNSAEFGNISISTSVTHQALSAQISLDHSELGRALAAHLPAMEERLGNAYGLQARVEVRDSAASSQPNFSQQSREGAQSRQSGLAKSGTFSSGLSTVAARSTSILASDSSRLDIRV